MRGGLRRFAIYVTLLGQLALVACQKDTTYHGRTAPGGIVGGILANYNIGEKVFLIARAKLDASPVRPAEKVAALDARKTEFVNAVNAIITPDSVGRLGPSILALFGLVDDGTLPRMADNFADVLESLRSEPGQPTLKAFVALGTGRTAVQTGDALDFTARVMNYSAIDLTFEAVAELIRLNDGVDDQGRPNGEHDLVREVLAFASRLLREAGQAPRTTGSGLFDGLTDELLVEVGTRGAPAAGAAAWAVRVDANGNPAVVRDPATGALAQPFVDRDGDGAADIDTNGDPVDGSGRTVSIAAFGTPGAPGYDVDGRAVDAHGVPIYEFFDAKKTLLSHFLQLGGEGLRRRIHELAADAAEIALGARVPNDAGTPFDPSDDFLGFAPTNPVVDASWGMLEIAKYQHLPKLLRAISEVERTDPALAERILVGIGKVVEKIRPIALAPSSAPPSAQTRALTDRALELGDRVFDRGTQPSTGRLLFDVVHDLGQTVRNLPRQVALMIDYSKLVVDSNGNVVASQSILVDRSRPATRAGSSQGENRAILHQLLDLLAEADGCPAFLGLFGRPLAEVLIELMAGQSPAFVGTLIDFLDNVLVKAYLTLACPAVKDDLLGLKGLSASGALDGFLPIAKVFVDRGQTRLLIDILKTLDQSYPDVVREYEPVLSDILKSGAIEVAFDLDDLIVAGGPNGQAVVDPVSGDRAIDVVADSIANFLDHPSTGIPDRMGHCQPTLAHLVIEPLRRIEDQVYAASGGTALANSLGYAVTDLVIERVTNDNGTPGDPRDDFEQLKNPNLGPFIGRMLDIMARNLPADAAQRAAKLADVQQDLVRFMGSRDFAAAEDLSHTLRHAGGAQALRDASIHLLTPDLVAADDVFGSLLKVLAGALQTRVDTAPIRDIARFAADLFDPATRRIVAIVEGFSRILQADRGRVCISVLRNTLNEPPATAGLPAGSSPAEVLLSIYEDVRAAGQAGTLTRADRLTELNAAIDSAIHFIRDPDGALQQIFTVIRNRPRH